MGSNEKKVDERLWQQLYMPPVDSHKGQNGRLLVIGGSKLFHASIFWSADVASKIVDLVHFCSPANENNELIRKKLKEGFWNGIVVDWGEVEEYINEDDCVLIGPGMGRVEDPEILNIKYQMSDEYQNHTDQNIKETLDAAALKDDTRTIVNTLLARYPTKKWVVDGGALQEVEPGRLNGNMIITPHQGEWTRLLAKAQSSKLKAQSYNSNLKIEEQASLVSKYSVAHEGVTILLKGKQDIVCRGEEWVMVEGGNAGMTKGGTGDVLAGLVAALYCKNEALVAAQAGSYINKKAGEALAERVGVNFNAGDLVEEVPKQLHRMVEKFGSDS